MRPRFIYRAKSLGLTMPMFTTFRTTVLAILLMASEIGFAAQPAPDEQLLTAASNAFAAGDYHQALVLYQRLVALNDSPASHYNLAVCYYKLGQYSLAQQTFLALYEQDPLNDGVLLNLAITEMKLGHLAQAYQRLVLLLAQAQSPTVAAVAFKNYQHVIAAAPYLADGDTPVASADSSWLVNAALGFGADDNVVSVVDNIASTTSDTYTEASLSAAWYSSGDFRNNWLLEANAFSTTYRSESAYDIDAFNLGITKHIASDRRAGVQLGLRMGQSSVGGEQYLQTFETSLARMQPLSNVTTLKYGLRYQHSSAQSAQFEPFAGQSLRFSAQLRKRRGQYAWWLGYRFDYDDKNDELGSVTPLGNTAFTSYSPNRHSLYGAWAYTQGPWQFRLEADYRDSRYREAQINDDGSAFTRADQRLELGAIASRSLSSQWSLEISLRQMDNHSNAAEYRYDQQLAELRLRWQND